MSYSLGSVEKVGNSLSGKKMAGSGGNNRVIVGVSLFPTSLLSPATSEAAGLFSMLLSLGSRTEELTAPPELIKAVPLVSPIALIQKFSKNGVFYITFSSRFRFGCFCFLSTSYP